LKRIISYVIIILSAIIVTSCSLAGLNISRSTPRKAFKYPEFSANDYLRGALNKYRSCFDVKFYSLNVDVNIEKKSIVGRVDIDYIALNNFDTLQIDLYKNMQIDSIVSNNNKLSYYRTYNAVFVIAVNPILTGEKGSIQVYYHGKPTIASKPPWEGGFVWSKDDSKNPWIGVACEVAGASLWWPCKDHLSDEPDSMHINISVPQGLFCVCNGQLADSITYNNKTTYKWRVNYPINTYNATLYIGKYSHFSQSYQGIDTVFNLNYYVLPYNLEKAKNHFKQVDNILGVFEQKFGEYPWPNDGFKLVESPYAGMEHQSAIAYGDSYKNRYGLFDYIILHETAHEWWGNSITVADYADVWLQEGFATYSEAIYVEQTRDYNTYINYLNVYSWFVKNKRPVIGPFNVNYWDYKDGDVYFKGALTLHTLRNIIDNDSVFFDIIHTFYNKFKYKIVCTNDFISIVNEKMGSDYNWFFKQYLYNRTCPELVYKFSYSSRSGSNVLYYKWNNLDADFQLPVNIECDGTKNLIFPTREWQRLDFPKTFKEIYVNPNNSYIAQKRVKKLK
jgi:aminopeptidase N